MKKLLTFIVAFGFILTANAFAQDKMMNQNQLPNQIKQYVQTNFPDSKIAGVEKDDDVFGPVEYTVWLNNGTEIEFEKTKMVSIESNSKLPASVISDKIAEYVSANYTNSHVVSFDLDDNKQGVELNNGMELVFDAKGNFVGMND